MSTERTAPPRLTAVRSSIVVGEPSTAVRSSTVEPSGSTAVRSSTVKSRAERIRDIDYKRAAARLTHTDLCRRASVQSRTWSNVRRGRWDPTEQTLARLEAAVAGVPARKPPEAVKTLHRRVMIDLCKRLRAPPERVFAQDLSVQRPRNEAWLQAARISRMAIYIVAVELVIGNAELGRALGCTRQNVKQARDDVFDWIEDDRKVARAIAAVSADFTGRIE